MASLESFWKDICLSLTQRTAQILDRHQVELSKIKWVDGEANTDSGFSKVACSSCEEAWGQIKVDYPYYKDLTILCSSPDITITFLKDSKPVLSSKIELKSGKGKGLIPGSTIGNLDINEPVIFCLRNEFSQTFQFRYSQYHNCIGESNTDMFQDRTPRPHVNFQKMTEINTRVEYKHKEKNDWVEHYAICALFRTKSSKPYKSWQDNLTAAIIKNFIKETSIEEFAKLKTELN